MGIKWSSGDAAERRLTKGERRQNQRDKDRRGMQVSNTSIRLLARMTGVPKAAKPRKGKS